ncbi:hypothetical protein FH593_21200 (plasmid) [Leptospira interrogans]|uniref:Uncharacterized protein n=3 Tax=Leptospira interrogans TaxID=173 RepID=A0A0E2D8F5_LEPIR|nr:MULTISPECIES: hypothetical protein [Leptospira]EKR56407.1 hypothetical protein LEP1GSC105_4239 [Leptospira interrogans str. UI 12758]EMJ34071.1 hypothetical protein LEP1GSC079_5189 [Leptospira interrogans str. FPW1039]EMN93054.1 hypothetical protein LEP1GSC110_0256 [Leptospira interrogans serovar Medanensis str. UT053]KGE21904.1 hypothetical protein IQ65_21770 [Leptospira interrogans serovar Lai]MCL8311299.1 hypothetical protein [Leptospira interrogans]
MEDREEYHIYKHIAPNNTSPRVWGSAGQECFTGIDGLENAIKKAIELQKNAPLGVEYSVQKYVYSKKTNYRPVKTKVWKNGEAA